MQGKNNQANRTTNPVHIIGTDASGLEKIPSHLKKIILSTNQIAAPKRILDTISDWWVNTNPHKHSPELFPSDKPKELIEWLQKQTNQTVVLASGDPLWFGIGKCLIDSLPENRLIFHPSISSLQLAFARLNRSWHDASWISLHGRDPSPLAKRLQGRPKALAILPDPSRGGAQEVRQYLRSAGLERSYAFWICEQLGHKEERIQRLLPSQELTTDLHPLHIVVLISQESSTDASESLPLFGIDDGVYTQHPTRPGLMTKREIRVQLIADLELPYEGVIWDIGAGVGSIGLETLRIRPKLQLLAIDKRVGTAKIIQKNANKLSVNPSKIIENEILETLAESNLPEKLKFPDRVILGGGGSDRNKILKILIRQINPGGIIVIPLVTLEAVSQMVSILKASKCKLSVGQHQHFRGIPLADGTRLSPMNPIFILKGKF